ncbi:MAG: hypothetical protein H6908_02840 [Hyphomicrobiales bacterium]|nr:hypothetical protein [Rickettsiales bacterium]MCP5361566.1 hypothetical protein [Hyphomicrobiales bacterium]
MKKRYSSIVLLPLVIILAVPACTGKGGTLDLRKPVSLNLEPPPGPPEYRQGWSDGCESGLNSYVGTFYKLIRAFDLKMDPKLRNNKMYYNIWKDAFLYCAGYGETIKRMPY